MFMKLCTIRLWAEKKSRNPTVLTQLYPFVYFIIWGCIRSISPSPIFIRLSKDGSYYVLTLFVCLSVCLSINFSSPLHIFLKDWRILVKLWSNGQHTKTMCRTYTWTLPDDGQGHKTKLAELSYQRQQALFYLHFQGSYTGPLRSSFLLIWFK